MLPEKLSVPSSGSQQVLKIENKKASYVCVCVFYIANGFIAQRAFPLPLSHSSGTAFTYPTTPNTHTHTPLSQCAQILNGFSIITTTYRAKAKAEK